MISLFHYAAEVGHWPIMEPLVEEYCKHEKQSQETFLIACRHGQAKVLENMLAKTHISVPTSIDGKWLSLAAESGQLSTFKVLVTAIKNRHHNINIRGRHEILCSALRFNDDDLLYDILSGSGWSGTPLDIDGIDTSTGMNVLQIAAMHGRPQIIQRLLLLGVKLDTFHLSCLCLAIEGGHIQTLAVLLPEFLDVPPDSMYCEGVDMKKVVKTATEKGDYDIMKLLLQYMAEGFRMNEFRSRQARSNIVDVFVVKGRIDLLELVLEYHLGHLSTNAVYLAAQQGHTEVIHWLAKHGVDMYQRIGQSYGGCIEQ